MRKQLKPTGPRPITAVSNGALWQGKRTPYAFSWVHVMDLPPRPTPRERLKALLEGLPLTAKQQARWAATLDRMSSKNIDRLLGQLEKLSPAQQYKTCNL